MIKQKSEYHALIGRMGGKKTLENKGKKHFSIIGKKGRAKQLSTSIKKEV